MWRLISAGLCGAAVVVLLGILFLDNPKHNVAYWGFLATVLAFGSIGAANRARSSGKQSASSS